MKEIRTSNSSTDSHDIRRDAVSDKSKKTYAHKDSLAAELSRDSSFLPLSESLSVSIIVPTRDRPDCLRECLESLIAQTSIRPREIIVVDNNPGTGATAGVVEKFPQVKLIGEQRPGASYARNAGICASRGDIIVFVDDDIVAPPQWLENIIAPLNRDEVLGVTGNVLPYELDSEASRIFESYANGGFNRGSVRWDADNQWFLSHKIAAARTWLIGGTGNAAFKSSVFCHPGIGLFVEHLGAGMPTGGAEDLYFFYRTLRSGGTIAYEPTAFVWHKHRSSIKELRRQLYGYSKGIVSYHLTTLLNDSDCRAIPSLLHLPVWHLTNVVNRLLGKSSHPISLTVFEMLGNLFGPISLWQSIQKAKCVGTSGKYIVPAMRAEGSAHQSESSSIVMSIGP